MADKKLTIYQQLSRTLFGVQDHSLSAQPTNNYTESNFVDRNEIIDTANSQEEKDFKILQAKQQKLLANQWYKAGRDINNRYVNALSGIRLQYYEMDLFDASCPEASSALDIIAEDVNTIGKTGMLINVSSSSDRVKSVLQDLFVNRLTINVTLPMLTRSMLKYGNSFWLLNTDPNLGIIGWKELPVKEVERYENGMDYPYTSSNINTDNNNDTKFVWVGQTQATQYRNWQVAHFRLLYDSALLPYGVGLLNKARRHLKMLNYMEDMLLMYRLDRSVERRVFKINVGAIDEADVPAYVQKIADNFKRSEIIDPATGQIDLRKNIMPVWKKTPIPLLDGRTITIEELASEYEEGKTNYVYSIQDNTHNIVAGKVVWCGKNYTADKMIKITLCDDTFMMLAPEHEVIMIDGSKKRAYEIIVGERVMPFYRKNENNTSDGELVYNPNSGYYEYTHNLISSELSNNEKQSFTDNAIVNRDLVKSVEYVDGDDVYCMTVVGMNGEEDRHNFALRTFNADLSWSDCGCFVSNCQTNDFFIPVREDGAPSPIENLTAGQNLTAMDDIKYIQNKIFTALRVPKSFLNFEESVGDGKNLSLLDVRFMRTVNRIQQALLMELNKIATIHLLMLGFTDDLTNFTLSMNNPSTQAEMLQLENLAKKVTTARDAVSDSGNGMPLTSMNWAWRNIFNWSDKEIQQNLEEMRLETALLAELQKTESIIKRTNIFDPVDNVYGEPGATYPENSGEGEETEDSGFGGGGVVGGASFGGDMDFGDDMDAGSEGEMDMGDAVNDDFDGGDGEMMAENITKTIKNGIKPKFKPSDFNKKLIEKYIKTINHKEDENEIKTADIYDKAFFMNEEMNSLVNELSTFQQAKLND